MNLSDPLTYQYTIDIKNDQTTAGRILRLVGLSRDQGRPAQVLELGCAAGSMTAALVQACGCSITGVEIDPDAAELARPHLARLIVGDLDMLDWGQLVEGQRYDVIIAADVLEHLRDPWSCLRKVAAHLQTSGGRFVTSLPNVGHLSVVAGLLRGDFTYSKTGLLDQTHIRFFTPRGVAKMLAETGLGIEACEFVLAGPEHPETERHWEQLGWLERQWLSRQREARVYQSVFACRADGEVRVAHNLRKVEEALGQIKIQQAH